MKKILLSLLCAASAIAPALAETKTYQLCTDLAEIRDANNEFVIVAGRVLNGAIYGLGSTVSSVIKIQDVTGDVVPQELQLDATALKLDSYSLKANGAFCALYDNTTEYYIGGNKSGTNIATIQTLESTNTSYQLAVSYDNGVKMTPQVSPSRALFFQLTTSTKAFKNYDTASNWKETATSYARPLFYKAIVSGPQDPEFTGFEELYTVEAGSEIDVPSIKPSTLSYTFKSQDENIAKVDNGKIVGVNIGTTTIDFTTEAVDGKYNKGNGSFKVKVTGLQPSLSFRDQVVLAKLGVGVVWEQVQVEVPANPEQQGDITYSSSNEAIATVDATTGKITLNDLNKVGTVTITATMASKGEYDEGSASYEIVIYDPTSSVSIAKFDFSVANPYGMTTLSNDDKTTSNKYEREVGKKVNEIAEGPVTINFNKTSNYRSWKSNNTYDLRMYNGSDLTISVPEEYKLTKIGLVASGDDLSKLLGTFNPAGITNDITGTGATVENTTWYPIADTEVHTVKYSVPATTNIWQIFVMYEDDNSDLKSVDLGFAKNVNAIYVDKATSINAAKSADAGFDRKISYTIEGLTGDEYIISPAEDGETIEVLVTKPGTYTLKASTVSGDGYRDGLAIMRLNVYRHLDVTIEGEPIDKNEEGQEEINTENAVAVDIEMIDNAYTYYQIVTADTPATEADDYEMEPGSENQIKGYTLCDNGTIEVPAKTNGQLNFYIANYGYISPIRTIILQDSTSTGISEVSGGVKANEVYDLMGRKVVRPANGLYIVNGVKVRL